MEKENHVFVLRTISTSKDWMIAGIRGRASVTSP